MPPKTMEIAGAVRNGFKRRFPVEFDRETARQFVGLFTATGRPVKVKMYHQPCRAGTYRILCFIRKSAEAVIINNRRMGRDGVSFQERIDNQSTLDRPDLFCERTREQTLSASDCRSCSAKCEGKKYTFVYRGISYTEPLPL